MTKNYIVEFSDRTNKRHIAATHVTYALDKAAGQRKRKDCFKSSSRQVMVVLKLAEWISIL